MVDKSNSEQSRRQNLLDFPEHELFPWIDRRQVNGRELYNLKAWNSQSKQKEEGRLDLLCSGTETPQLFCFEKMENTQNTACIKWAVFIRFCVRTVLLLSECKLQRCPEGRRFFVGMATLSAALGSL